MGNFSRTWLPCSDLCTTYSSQRRRGPGVILRNRPSIRPRSYCHLHPSSHTMTRNSWCCRVMPLPMGWVPFCHTKWRTTASDQSPTLLVHFRQPNASTHNWTRKPSALCSGSNISINTSTAVSSLLCLITSPSSTYWVKLAAFPRWRLLAFNGGH